MGVTTDDAILATAEFFGGRREVRLIGDGAVQSIICDGPEELARVAGQHNGRRNVYIGLGQTTLPPGPRPLGSAVTAEDIEAIEFLAFDLDPLKGDDKMPLPGEEELARAEAIELRDELRSRGWSVPVGGSSGAGWWLVVAVEMPNNDETRDVRRSLLWAYKQKYPHLDTSTFDASRVARFFGTDNVKYGDPRPTRIFRYDDAPEHWAGRQWVGPRLGVADLKAAIDALPSVNGNGHRPKQAIRVGSAIPKGEAHGNMLSTIGVFAATGRPRDEVEPVVLELNGGRLPEGEVIQLLDHAYRKEASKRAGLPEVRADNGDLVEMADEAWAALLEANDPPTLFRRGTLVRIETDDRGEPFTNDLTHDRTRYQLARVARWQKKVSGDIKPAHPPDTVVRDLLATPDPPLPILDRIVKAPVFAPDGSLSLKPGYQDKARVFYTPSGGLEIPEVAESPADEDVRIAVKLLRELVADFPFTGDAEQAHAFSIPLTMVSRDLIDGPTPLHLITKPSPGTGASLLAQASGVLVNGTVPTMLSEGGDDAEWGKRITSTLMRSPAMVVFDNITRRLDAGTLSKALTDTMWSDRLLGRNREVTLPVSCVWVATANNPSLSQEIARRCVRIRLDTKTDKPWERVSERFLHPDLMAWVGENRGELLWACYTLVRAWLVAGKPKPSASPLGSFESWSRVIGGTLEVAGINGFLGNSTEFYEEADAESDEWRALTTAWFEKFSDTWITSKVLFSIATDHITLGGKDEKGQTTALGNALRRQKDKSYSGLRIERGELEHGARLWRVTVAGGS